MTTFYQWVARWSIPPEAVEDLLRALGAYPPEPQARPKPGSEAAVQTETRLEYSKHGARLYRNNVGATYTKDGSFIRFGLANESAQMNAAVKSSDLIGPQPVTVRPEHVGRVFGIFVARECKRPDWRFTGTARELAQLNFLLLISKLGGDAAFCTGPGTFKNYNP